MVDLGPSNVQKEAPRQALDAQLAPLREHVAWLQTALATLLAAGAPDPALIPVPLRLASPSGLAAGTVCKLEKHVPERHVYVLQRYCYVLETCLCPGETRLFL